MAEWPTLPEVRTLLRLVADSTEDAVIQNALDAAIDYGNRRTSRQWDPADETSPGWATPLPDVVHEAALFHAARLYRRRDSIDGTISWGDAGAVRVGRADPDVDALYSSVAPWVFG
jgi:hypothetical protein